MDGIKYGKGLFETIKVVDKKLVYFEDHMDRLEKSMKFLNIKTDFLRENIEKEIDKLDLNVGCVRVMVLDNDGDYDLTVTTRNTDYSDLKFTQGLKLKTLEPIRDKNNPLVFHKTNNYLLNDLMHKKIVAEGYDEGVFLNQDENITEGTYTNVFFIKGNSIITPPVEDGLLPGIYRKNLIEFLNSKSYKIEIRSINKMELSDMQSCFVTNSLMEMRFVKSIDDKEFEKTDLLLDILSELDIK